MGRYKYTLSYDGSDQENAMVCGILAALGNKRSAVVRELIMDAVRRFGVDVLRKENVNVLIYLINHTDVTGIFKQPVTGSADRMETTITFLPEKKQKSRAKGPESKNAKKTGQDGSPVTEIQMPQNETGKQDTEPVREPPEEFPGNESEHGAGSLLDFLNVGIFEGQ